MATAFQVQGRYDAGAKRIGKDNTATLGWQIINAADEFIAMTTLEAAIASAVVVKGVTLVYDSLKLTHVECETWEADVSYIHPDKQKNEDDQNDDGPQLSISTTGSTQHITHSLASLRAYPALAFGKHKQAISVEHSAKGEKKIKGCDIIVPTLKVKLSAKIPRPAQPLTFGQNMARRTGKTNRGPYGPFGKWELLFLGGTLTGKLRDKWALDYEFEGSETITAAHGFKIGELGPIEKEGHAHMWVEWGVVAKAGVYVHGIGISKDNVIEPIGVHIEQIYWDFDLADLGL